MLFTPSLASCIRPMKHSILCLLLVLITSATTHAADDDVKNAMRRATQYMMDVVAYQDGFVWNYLPDFSRQWGELEAKRTMVWLQTPSTPDIGQVLIDAYHATGDEYYYDCALRVVRCIVRGQLPCGGWNYMFDLEPEDSLKAWYATIGRQAWRLEEFQHYYGNATFDDEATKHCSELILRLYLEKHDPTLKEPLDKAIDFMLKSQYDNGGWPQRFPLMYNHPFRGKADYSSFITINDNVMPENIDFLLQCYQSLGMSQLKEPVLRAMYLMRDLQQPLPLAGWADQYTPDDLKPAHARSYEPRSVNTGTTVSMIFKMMEFYQLTGDESFLKGIPDAITFLESLRLPSELAHQVRRTPLQDDEILVPRFIDPDSQRPMYVHRKGGNVANGIYYTDSVITGTIAHYSSFMVFSPSRLRDELKRVKALVQQDLQRNSPLLQSGNDGPLPFYYQRNYRMRPGMVMPEADDVVKSLDEQGRWISPLRQVSNPYQPLPKDMASECEDRQYAQTMVGDQYDTSPYENHDIFGISTQTYIRNMVILINSLRPKPKTTASGLNPERFHDTVEGKQTQLFTLTNGDLEASITNYGARLVALMVPDRVGHRADVVLGFDNITDYHRQKNNFGSIVGRYIGRIKGAEMTLDGINYQLQQSGGGNISHGGYPGFADHVWEVVHVDKTTLTLQYVSPDGENGFPGELTVRVTYTLTTDNALKVEYEATTDKPTVLNLSNHSFFNLSGDLSTTVLSQQLFIDSKRIATYDEKKNLNGQFLKVKHTPFDFTKPKTIGEDIDNQHPQLIITKGYDHAFVLNHPGHSKKLAAVLYDEGSGRRMMVYTDQPAVQLYTANGLNGMLVGKWEVAYPRRSAVCLETMHLSDSPHHPEFPSTVLRPGETFRSQTTFCFDTK